VKTSELSLAIVFSSLYAVLVAVLGPQDVILGSIANLIAGAVIFSLRKRQFLACVLGSLPVGIIVGSYLWLIFEFQPPDIFGLQLPMWGAMILSITISSLITVAGIGYILLKALSGFSITTALKSRGVKTYN
jgi:Na+/proline symporter